MRFKKVTFTAIMSSGTTSSARSLLGQLLLFSSRLTKPLPLQPLSPSLAEPLAPLIFQRIKFKICHLKCGFSFLARKALISLSRRNVIIFKANRRKKSCFFQSNLIKFNVVLKERLGFTHPYFFLICTCFSLTVQGY